LQPKISGVAIEVRVKLCRALKNPFNILRLQKYNKEPEMEERLLNLILLG